VRTSRSLFFTRGASRLVTEAAPGLKDTEHDLERAVSDHIGRMPFLWLAVPDAPGRDSYRAYIEVNATGLLSNFGRAPVDPFARLAGPVGRRPQGAGVGSLERQPRGRELHPRFP
jgi:hypothetical protein